MEDGFYNRPPFLNNRREIMIEFKDVSKTYPNGTKGLKHVNLQIEQGEFIAIIGLSGAGKSTLIRTINRMIDITDGQLIVDGTDVMSLKGKELRKFRRKIGMIFQSFNLVSRSTVIKNVLSSNVPDMPWYKTLFGIYSKEQKLRALEALDKVNILDKAYSRCDELSGGQKQRIAIARAILKDAPILLLDEATSALDTQSEKLIQAALNDLMQGRTTFVIAHRLSTILDADIICVIKDGQIVEMGTDAELCALGGEYKKLRDIQFKTESKKKSSSKK